MALTCGQCGKIVYREKFMPSSGTFLGVDCGCAAPPRPSDHDDPFRNEGELVLQHVHDDQGKPLRVTSRRQLEEAQSRYGFSHVPTNMDRANWDSPRQQKTYTVSDLYRRKFARQ